MTIKVNDFINTSVKDYALDVLYNRAIPLFEDGLKPTKRRILYTAIKTGYNVEKKTLPLVGYTIAETNYNHGNTSVEDSINNLAKNFIPYNNLPMFVSENSFGNRLSPEAPACRYTSLKLSNHFNHIFKKDIELLEYNDDNFYKYFLPLIPFTILNGESGIATGFSCNIYPRNIIEVLNYIIDYIDEKGNNSPLFPFFDGFTGEIGYDEEKDNFYYKIPLKRKGNMVIIDEFSPFEKRESFITLLDKYKEDKKIDYIDESSDNPNFRIRLKENFTDDEVIDMFKLHRNFPKDNITIIKNGNIKVYKNIKEYLNDWIDWRKSIFDKKIEYNMLKIKNKATEIKSVFMFIKYCIEKLDFKKVKKPDYIKVIEDSGFEEYKQKLLDIPIYNFSTEGLYDLKVKYDKLKKEYINEKNKTAKDEYMKELKNLLSIYR